MQEQAVIGRMQRLDDCKICVKSVEDIWNMLRPRIISSTIALYWLNSVMQNDGVNTMALLIYLDKKER